MLSDPLNQVRAAFLPGAMLLAARGRTGDALVVLVLLGIATLPRLLALPRPFEAALVVAISMQAIGGMLHLFRPDFGYDLLVHATLTASGGACAYLALVRARALPDPTVQQSDNHAIGIVLVAAALGMALGSLWEVAEATSDELFGTSLVRSSLDTSGDLLANAVGALVGGALLASWARRSTWNLEEAAVEGSEAGLGE